MKFSKSDFEKLFKDNYERLCYYAYDFLGDMEASEDIVSDVFTTMWDKQDKMDVNRNVKNFLYTCVHNRCISYLRQNKPLVDINNMPMQLVDSNNAESENELIEEINGIIDKLPKKTRTILDLCIYEKKTYKEVAVIMGISPDGVKKHIVKAYAIIRGHFELNKEKSSKSNTLLLAFCVLVIQTT